MRNRSLWLIIGAGLVAVVRYIGVFMHAEGSNVAGWLWDVVNGFSGAGMAVLEAVGIWHCWEAWSQAQPSRNRNVLLVLIIGMFTTLAVMLTPYVFAASQKAGTATTLAALAPAALWAWSAAVVLAPILVMAASGLADTLLRIPRAAQQGDSEAFNAALVSQAVQGAIGALQPRFEALAQDWQRDAADLRRSLQAVQAATEAAPPQLQAAASERNITPVVAITERTRNVAVLRSRGQTAKEIADGLGVSVRTVESEISKAKAAGLLNAEVRHGQN